MAHRVFTFNPDNTRGRMWVPTTAVIARVAANMSGNTEIAPARGTKSPKKGSSIAMKVVKAQYTLRLM